MSVSLTGALGDVVRVSHALAITDPATRRRVNELLLGLEPAAVEPPSPPPSPSPPPPLPPPPPQRQLLSKAMGALRRVIRRDLRPDSRLQAVVAVASTAALFIALLLTVGLLPAAGVLVACCAALRRILRPNVVPTSLRALKLALDPVAVSGRLLELPGADEDPPLEPLLLPRWTAGILSTALAIEKRDGPLDLDRIVDALARLQTPTELPRRSRRTLDEGVDVLVDLSEGMLPFEADTEEIIQRMRRVVGYGRISVLEFDLYPLTEIFEGTRATSGTPQPPQVPRTVLAITSFGLFGPPEVAAGPRLLGEWLELAQRLRHAGCPIVALVPYRSNLVEPALRRHISIIEWDRTTTVAGAANAVAR
jgi:hypothetical protein